MRITDIIYKQPISKIAVKPDIAYSENGYISDRNKYNKTTIL